MSQGHDYSVQIGYPGTTMKQVEKAGMKNNQACASPLMQWNHA